MRKAVIIALILIVAALGYGYYVTQNDVSTEKTGITPDDSGSRHDPSNATFIFDDESITLSNGKSERTVAPGSAITEEIVLLDKFAYGDINADNKEDTALLLTRYGGGSGTFIYAAAFVSGPVTYKGTDAVFIGDRVSPQSISIDRGVVTVKYLDRKPGEALATEPTVENFMQFVYRNGEFQTR